MKTYKYFINIYMSLPQGYKAFYFNAHSITLDNRNDETNDHINLFTTGNVGENDLHLKNCNLKVAEGSLLTNTLKSLDGTTMIDFDNSNNTIDFNNKSISNFNLSASLATSSVASSNYPNFDLEYELDKIHDKIDLKANDSGYTGNKLISTTGGGVITASINTADVVLSSTLADYSTTASINTTLADYSTTASINTTLADYSTTASINTTLADYSTLNTDQSFTAEKAFNQDSSGALLFKKTKTLQPIDTYLKAQDHASTSVSDRTIYLPSINTGQTTDTLVGEDTTATLTNKTLTSPIISAIHNGSAVLTMPDSSGTLALTSQLTDAGISESDDLEFLGDFAINNYDVGNENELVLKGIGGGLITNTAQDLTLRNQADSNGGYFKMFSGSSGTAISIASDNKVGIGNTEAFSQLHIAKASASTSISTAADFHLILGRGEHNVGSYRLMGLGYVSSQASVPPTYMGFLTSNNAGSTQGHLVFGTRNSTNNTTVPTERMRITDDGQIGIGTTSPSSTLHIKDSNAVLTIETTSGNVNQSYAWIDFKDSAGSKAWIGDGAGSNNAFYIYASRGQNIALMNGKVGIGNTSPSCPLHVSGSNTGVTSAAGRYFNVNSTGLQFDASLSTDPVAIFASSSILTGSYFLAASDERIKKDIQDVPDDLSLQTLQNIPVRYYKYKDPTREDENVIGFIAQEVKEVFPLAVKTTKNSIPDEVRSLENISWVEENYKWKMSSDLSDVSGIAYKFYITNDMENFKEEQIVGNSDDTFTFDQSYNHIFCYGKEVDDFHILDKQKLFALNFSATQELHRQVITLQNEKEALQTENTRMAADIVTMKQQIQTLFTLYQS